MEVRADRVKGEGGVPFNTGMNMTRGIPEIGREARGHAALRPRKTHLYEKSEH